MKDNRNNKLEVLSETARVRIEKLGDVDKKYVMKHHAFRNSHVSNEWKEHPENDYEHTEHKWLRSTKASDAFREEMDIINDKLCRINIYFIKETEADPKTKIWADVGTLGHTEELLDEIMEFLNIDPKATSY